MRIRKLSALVGALILFGGCVVLYLIMDVSLFKGENREQNKWLHFEDRLNKLEANLNQHDEVVGNIKQSINQLLVNNTAQDNRNDNFILNSRTSSTKRTLFPWKSSMSCGLLMDAIPSTDVQMLEVYKEVKFDNLDGGVWKQGWNIEYAAQQWTREKVLKVFVVPHSHNDPGWIKTFEDYYRSQTRSILNNMVIKLKEDSRRKFIWAEISYLALWWDEIGSDVKEDAKKLVANGQLEIVTGGWVMPDEANAHYFGIITQLMEGHQWVVTNLGIKPTSSWSIDPFGQSPTMAFINQRAGLENLVLQRVHYSMKKHLAREKSLEFRWRQLWDGVGTTDMLTHLMPFYSYDVPHTCGPDPKVCCQFDFRRLPGYGMSCPWKSPPQVITKKNVAYRAEMLLDQYRKKSQLYRTNVVLAPLGDDFRYDHASEWDAQFENYQRIMDYLNENSNLHVEIQFGTLSDFFKAVRDEMPPESFPTLSGDFFSYADRDDHYWSGYYTSRPFYKRLDRVLVSYLRSAEIIFSLAWGSRPNSDWLLGPEWGLTKLLSDARQSLGLFQHHDGIAGTARDHVMEDYGRKMTEAIKGMQHVIQQSAHFLLSSPQVTYDPTPESVFFDLDDLRKHHYNLPEKTTLILGEGLESRKVVVYNSLAFQRQEMVVVRVSMAHVKVVNAEGVGVVSQTAPVFLHSSFTPSTQFDVYFMADVPALGLATYYLQASTPNEHLMTNTPSHIRVMNLVGDVASIEGFQVDVVDELRDFSVHNAHLTATFTKQGLLKAVRLNKEMFSMPIHLDFAKYSARPGSERSGAYLFLPDGDAQVVPVASPLITVIEGPIVAQVKVYLPDLQHTVILFNTPGSESLGLEIQNMVDITAQTNYELVMRLSSSIKNGDEFFTDLNGLQMIRRKRFPKLPLQGNYYPLPNLAYIEDKTARLSLVTAQPQGMGSMKEGQMEVMQDRRLNQDDNRGLGQGVTDNIVTITTYRLLLEKKDTSCQVIAQDHPGGMPSLATYVSMMTLMNPLHRLLWSATVADNLDNVFSPVDKEPGHDVHVLLLRAFSPPGEISAGLILWRQHFDTCFTSAPHYKLSDGKVNVSEILPHQFGPRMTPSSLTFIHSKGSSLDKRQPQALCPMDMNSYTFPR